jgi:2-phosphoglycerate kinase
MAKTIVIDSEEGTRVPFLRGILTRSLQDVGLEFDEAYKLATEVRDAVSEQGQIKSDELRKLVAERLHETHGDYTASCYVSDAAASAQVMVVGDDGELAPFSLEIHRKSIESAGVDEEEARNLSRMLGRHMVARKRRSISVSYLGRLTYRLILRELGRSAAYRYLVWRDFGKSGIPLLLLIGGAPGSGKSTIATALASRLDIFRTQSTDMLREVMRMMIPERLLPVLHRSSFEAWRALPDTAWLTVQEDRIASGYRNQTDLLTVACEAVVQRAVRERVSMVLEGVHIDPTVVKRLRGGKDIIVVPIMLAVLKQELLRNRIRGRGGTVPHRRAERYLKNFQSIWHLQSYMLSEADKEQIPIVVNENKEETVAEILRVVSDVLGSELQPSLKRVFPDRA